MLNKGLFVPQSLNSRYFFKSNEFLEISLKIIILPKII